MNFLAPYKLLIEFLVIGALIAGIAVGIHKFLSYEQQIGWDRREAIAVKDALLAKDAADKEAARLQQVVTTAVKQGEDRAKLLQASADAAAATNRGLRNTLDNIKSSLPATTLEACRNTAVTLAAVFGDCTARYGSLAEKADRHASDVRTLTEAWPR